MSNRTSARRHGWRYLIAALLLTVTAGAMSLWATSASAESTTPSTSASAAYPPPAPCTLTVGTVNLSPGQSALVTGSDFTPNTNVTLSLDTPATVLGTAMTDGSGDLNTTVKMPTTLTAGPHQIIASANNSSCQIGASYTAPSTPPTTPPSGGSDGDLAFTGFAAITAAILGGLLLIGGLTFQLVGRRRRA